MNEEQEDRMLSELFRQKLENAEVIPSPSAGRAVMSRLGRMEFLRFNPLRFNIWYAGGIIAAGAALAIILSSGNSENEKVVPDILDLGEIIITDPGAAAASTENQKPAVDVMRNAKQRISSSEKSSEATDMDGSDGDLQGQKQRHIIPSRPEVTGTLPENELFQKTAGGKNRLRSVKQVADLIEASVTEGCTPLKVLFRNEDLTCDSCKWTFGDDGYSYRKNPEWIFDADGEYEVTLQIFDSEGLLSVSSSVITVYPRPAARFEIVAGNTVVPDDEISFVNYSSNAMKFRWHFGDGKTSELFQPRHAYKSSGNYNVSLVAISDNGCTDTLTISNAYSGSGYFINFPNAFIPNSGGPSGGYYSQTSDEAARIFHPVHSGVSEFQMKIFSKLGVMVFESNDINIGWDGYYKGQLSEQGVYIWKVQGSFINGEPFTKAGDLTLIKN